MFHPYAGVTGRFEDDLEGHKGPSPLNIMCSEHYETDLNRGFVRGYSYQVTRSAAPVATAIGGKIPWGKNHHDEFKNRFNKTGLNALELANQAALEKVQEKGANRRTYEKAREFAKGVANQTANYDCKQH